MGSEIKRGCWYALLVIVCALLSATNSNAYSRDQKCDLYQGSWVYDQSYPMYDSTKCPHIEKTYDCVKYGRSNLDYLKFRWQPSHCSIPSFDAKELLTKMRGKKILYIGDSISLDQWQSMVCLIHAALPSQSNITQTYANLTTTVTYEDYGVSISVFLSHYLVDIEVVNNARVLKLDSISNGDRWKQYDVLIFNTWLWWYRKGEKQPWDYIQIGKEIRKDMDRMAAFCLALQTWGRWVDSEVDIAKTTMFFQGVSPTHYNGLSWNKPGVTNCANETVPISGSTYPGGVPKAEMVIEQILSDIKKPVTLLNITGLSQLRKDGHPSSFNAFRGMDCTHWCVAGVPDTWNQILYTYLV